MRPEPDDRYPAARAADVLATLRPQATSEVALTRRERRRAEARRLAREPRKPLPWPVTVILVGYRFVFILLFAAVTSGVTLGLLGWSAWRYLEQSMPPEVVVPDVTDKPEPDARALLQDFGLQVVVESTASRDVPEGRVVRMEPRPGRRVTTGRTIKLAVSTGPELVTVPRLRGETFASAQDILLRAGLKVGETARKPDDHAPAGTILSQNPGPGRRVDTGSKVDLFVSSGPEEKDKERPSTAELGPVPDDLPPEGPADGREERVGTVMIPVPSKPPQSTIRIVVRDDDGERVAYDAIHHAGDMVRQTVRGVGRSTVEVYINDRKVKEQDL